MLPYWGAKVGIIKEVMVIMFVKCIKVTKRIMGYCLQYDRSGFRRFCSLWGRQICLINFMCVFKSLISVIITNYKAFFVS